ncbi:MAG TPA: twin-arginine translocase TatA/TatE family subunit [Acidimicrobiales bacterium]|nr:twin-arginine translocase TatA/TatE family subunit [Acidimicrobiales bacterium]
MLMDLSPAKLLVILIVAVILLGPDKLPQVARQIGAAWRKLRDFQQRVDQEVRQNIPDLPSTQDIARFARSPVTLLNQWAEMPAVDDLVEDPAATAEVVPDDEAWPQDRSAAQAAPAPAPAPGPAAAELPPDDPGMN